MVADAAAVEVGLAVAVSAEVVLVGEADPALAVDVAWVAAPSPEEADGAWVAAVLADDQAADSAEEVLAEAGLALAVAAGDKVAWAAVSAEVVSAARVDSAVLAA